MIKISVIIPVFNSEQFIGKCIESVLCQSLKEIEIICVDDGSTDNSCNLIEKMRLLDHRVILFRQTHKCAAYARNYGLEMASGDYVAFLDADDYYVDVFALEKLYVNSKKYGAKVCAAELIYQDMAYEYIAPMGSISKHVNGANIGWVDFSDVQDDFLFTRYIFERSLLMNNRISFPLYLRYEDPPFLLAIMCLVKKFFYVHVTLYCYRINYKSNPLDKLQLMDTLLGITDNMILAFKNNYDMLYNKLIKRLCVEYRQHIIAHWSDEISGVIMRIANFHATTHYGENLLLKLISDWGEVCDYSRYIFPYHLFKKNDKIIVCGTGVVYKSFLYQLTNMLPYFVKVVAKIDLSKIEYSDFKKILNDVEYDSVLIALKNQSQFHAIKKILNAFDIDDEKIKWDGVNFIRENFYKNVLYNILPDK